MIKTGQTIAASDFILQATAGEALTANDAVYISSADNKAYKTDADDTAKIAFVGFAVETVSLGATINIRVDGLMGGFSGLTTGAIYYLSTTNGAITATKPTNYKVIGTAISTSVIRIEHFLTTRVTTYSPNTAFGVSTTRFDITNPSGTTFRYTWDGVGADPGINSGTIPVGSLIRIEVANFSGGNLGSFTVTGSGANYFEVTNASGVAENDKTLGQGRIYLGRTWTKIAGLKFIDIEMVGGGGGGGRSSSSSSSTGSSGAGGYSRRRIYASELAATENMFIGPGGIGGESGGSYQASNGGSTRFGTTLFMNADGGLADTGSGGLGGGASGGDINIAGGDGNTRAQGSTGSGTNYAEGAIGVPSMLSGRAAPKTAGKAYGGGGGGALNGGGSAGGDGVIIITENY